MIARGARVSMSVFASAFKLLARAAIGALPGAAAR